MKIKQYFFKAVTYISYAVFLLVYVNKRQLLEELRQFWKFKLPVLLKRFPGNEASHIWKSGNAELYICEHKIPQFARNMEMLSKLLDVLPKELNKNQNQEAEEDDTYRDKSDTEQFGPAEAKGLLGHLSEQLGKLKTLTGKDFISYVCFVRFEPGWLDDMADDRILNFLPVPGGLSFLRKFKDNSVLIGFETAHGGIETITNENYSDPEFLKLECELLKNVAEVAKKYSARYKEAKMSNDPDKVRDVLDKMFIEMNRDHGIAPSMEKCPMLFMAIDNNDF